MPLRVEKNDVHFQSYLLQTCLQLEQWSSNFSWIGLLASQLSALGCQNISSYGVFVMQKPVLVSVPVVSTVPPKVVWSFELYLYLELTVPQVSNCCPLGRLVHIY